MHFQLPLLRTDHNLPQVFRMEPQYYGTPSPARNFGFCAAIVTPSCQSLLILEENASQRGVWTLLQRSGISPQGRSYLLCEAIPVPSRQLLIARMAVASLQQARMVRRNCGMPRAERSY